MLARECSDKNVAVVGYSEAFGAVLFGKAGKHSVQLFKNRYTRFTLTYLLYITANDT